MLLVLSPLTQEMKTIQRGLEKRGFTPIEEKIGNLKALYFKELDICLSVGGHGKTQFAVQAQHLIQQSGKFNALICAGCAGSLHGDVRVLDVVVGSKTVEHDFNLKFVQKPLPEFAADVGLLEKIAPLTSKEFGIHIGPIASGDEDVVEADRVASIHKDTQALAVAWEGAGGARAARFNRLPFLEIRGVTDLSNNSSLQHALTNVELAMDHVSEILSIFAKR